MASSSAHSKNTTGHDKNAYAKIDHKNKIHDKNAHAKNDHHAKDDHDKNARTKTDHAKVEIFHKNTHAKDDHVKNPNAHAKVDTHDKNAHAKNVHDKSTKVDTHDKNVHAKNVHDKSTDSHAKNDHTNEVHDKNAHTHAKNDHAKDAHDKSAQPHGKPVHAKSDHDKGADQDKNVSNLKNDMFLATCPDRGEHEFMARNGTPTEHFWCGRCGQDGSGMRYKCKHCNYRLHENCYKARLEIKCPLRREGHKYITRDGATPFMCNGCREIGIGVRHKCELCYYRLHDKCYQLQKECKPGSARAPTTTNENFPGKVFHFIPQHPGNYPDQVCSPCGRNVCGFIFKATDADGKKVFLHPLCSNVKKEWDEFGMKFFVQHAAKAKCLVCQKKKSKGWSYASSCGNYSLHVSCVMDMILRSWKEGRLDEAKMQKYMGNIDLAELAEKLEKSTSMGKTFKKGGIMLLEFVTKMILENPKPIGGVIIGLLS